MPNGKICYVEIPATDIEASAGFYAALFGWDAEALPAGLAATLAVLGLASAAALAAGFGAVELGYQTLGKLARHLGVS